MSHKIEKRQLAFRFWWENNYACHCTPISKQVWNCSPVNFYTKLALVSKTKYSQFWETEIGIFMWKVLNDEESQTLEDNSSIRERNFGHNNAKFHFPLANTNLFKWDNVYQGPKLWNCSYPPRHWNTGLVSSWASLTSWGNPYSNSVTIKTPYGVDVLHQPASPFFSYRVG